MLAMGASAASAAIVTTFGESVPVSNIITSVEPANQDQNAWFNDGLPANNGNRLVTESFTVPAGPNYTLDKITMKLNLTLAADFTSPSGMSLDLYEIASPLNNPVSGTLIAGQVGTLQPTTATATAGSYFTFDLDNTVTLEGGKSYGYVLGMDNPSASYKMIRLAVGDADAGGSRAWQNTNGGGWVNTGATYTYYIQGTPVPEPAMGGLLLLGLTVLARRTRRA
jgi:hypothetical protein